MPKQKYYVVWKGRRSGIFNSWRECEAQVSGYVGAEYKAFESRREAEQAFASAYADYKGKPASSQKWLFAAAQPIIPSVAVDAACSGSPGPLEFQGVETFRRNVESLVAIALSRGSGIFLVTQVHSPDWSRKTCGNDNGIRRSKCLDDAVKAAPNITIVAQVPTDWNPEKALVGTENALEWFALQWSHGVSAVETSTAAVPLTPRTMATTMRKRWPMPTTPAMGAMTMPRKHPALTAPMRTAMTMPAKPAAGLFHCCTASIIEASKPATATSTAIALPRR